MKDCVSAPLEVVGSGCTEGTSSLSHWKSCFVVGGDCMEVEEEDGHRQGSHPLPLFLLNQTKPFPVGSLLKLQLYTFSTRGSVKVCLIHELYR